MVLGGPDPLDRIAPTMEAWAAARGLEYHPEGLLPPVTSSLRRGLGAGQHRANLQLRNPALRMTERGWVRKRPERVSRHLCHGTLPGGALGTLAQHVHLVDSGSSSDDGGTRWRADVATVVLVPLPSGSAALCTLQAGVHHGVAAALTLDRRRPPRSDDPRATAVPLPSSQVEHDGFRWSVWPAEPDRTLERIADPATREALRSAPAGTRIEVEFGQLCVRVDGRLIDEPAELDQLWELAGAVAARIAAVAAAAPPLTAAEPLPPEPESDRTRWVDAGVRLRPTVPPAPDVTSAQQSYRPLLADGARREGRRVGRAIVLAGAALSFVGAVLAVGFWMLLDEPLAAVGAIVGIGLLFCRAFLRGGRRAGRDHAEERIAGASTAWGLEAFARGYAAAHGLRQEDPDELRRRLPALLLGRAQKAWQGDLGDGLLGHLALWLDPTPDPLPPVHRLLAVVAAPPGGPSAPPASYRAAALEGGLCAVWTEVSIDGRSAAALDGLRAAARTVAGTPVRP